MNRKKKNSTPLSAPSSLTNSKKAEDGRKAIRKPQASLETFPHSSPEQEDRNDFHAHEFPIVGIGASAGGFEAFARLLSTIPVDSGMGFVLVQHLSPDLDSLMPELLAKHTSMPIQTVSDHTPVESNHLYIIPPNADLTIEGGILRVARPSQTRGHRTPIDIFFHSLAEDQGPRAICIILSGAGSDGTIGLRTVKKQGGLVIAQLPETAKFDSMPKSAIRTRLVDHILTVEAMPGVLIEYARHLSGRGNGEHLDSIPEESMNNWESLYADLLRRESHDFRHYTQTTLSRRVQRRMQVLHLDSASQYEERLREDQDEVDRLFTDLLIGGTQFFGDPETFLLFSTDIIPKIVKSKQPGEPMRIWIPGCSTGEEAYSIAIVLHEYLSEKMDSRPFHIFATDTDEQALNIARRGRYPATLADHLSPDRVTRFFKKDASSYCVIDAVRESCTFSHHTLIGAPPFSRIDAIFCRNLLLYMESRLQQQILSLFHYSLQPRGYLLLGPSDRIAAQSPSFQTVSHPHRIFQAKETLRRISMNQILEEQARGAQGRRTAHVPRFEATPAQRFDYLVQQVYGPAAVLIDEDGTIRHISGQTQQYFQRSPGSEHDNLLNLVRPDVRAPLRSGIHQALKTGKTVIQENLQLPGDTGLQHFNLIVRLFPDSREGSKELMVVFQERRLMPLAHNLSRVGGRRAPIDNAAIPALELEIVTIKDHLRTTVDQLKTSNEELKFSNEELLSMNEELQSINEEYQTSKEELQGIKVELETMNAELQRTVQEINRTNNDIENLFRSTEIATLFLDMNLRVKRFTPAAQTIFGLRESDIGRPVSDLTSFFKYETLAADLEDVLHTLVPKETERTLGDGYPRYLSRIFPYHTTEGQIQGVVLTLVDITNLRTMENTLLRFSAQQKVITAFGQFALQEYDLQRVMDECVRQIMAVLPIEFAKVLELRPDGQSFLLRAGRGWKEGLVGHTVLGVEGESQAGYALSVNEPVIVTDLSQETRFSGPSFLIDHHVLSGMSCIICDRAGHPHGVLGVHSSLKRKFSADDAQFLQTIAQILASAIHRKNIEIQLQAMNDSLEDQVKDRTQALLHHQQRIRNLSSELILTEHRERRRIANELHDYLAQLLVVAKIEVCKLEDAGLSESISRIVADIEDVLDKALKYTQDLIPQISPPVLYEFGLKGAIPWLAEKMARYNLHVMVTSQVDDQTLRLPESVSIILYHVLRELLFNVIKHAKTGEARIAITQDSPEFISFEVADRGSGFDVQSILGQDPRLQKFGLLNVQERIESLAGQCRIHSTKGEGTRILITVPVSTDRAVAAPAPHSSPLIPGNAPRRQDGVIRVVLADDHSIFREGLRTLLEACPDIRVVGEAENGEQAITLAQTLHPDAVVMDINMPVMNGIEATRLIKNTLPLVYIIGLSMHSDQIVKNAFSDAGGDHYVTKGDSFNTFAEIIRDSQKGSVRTD